MVGSDPWDIVAQLAKSFLPRLPLIALWLIGAALCLVRWRRHPWVSLLALGAFLLLILESVLELGAHLWLLHHLPDSAGGGDLQDRLDFQLMVFRAIDTAIDGLAWILLLVALFGWRRQPVHPEEKAD